ncbi:hypothetical protein PMAYCL1PPCAC_31853, partial [Pristionchus mayeri]
ALLASSNATAKIKCYSCIVPPQTGDPNEHCVDSQYCTGKWCTKGPDASSSGILYGCIDDAPLEVFSPRCKAVNSTHFYYNCYCNNVEYCNGG